MKTSHEIDLFSKDTVTCHIRMFQSMTDHMAVSTDYNGAEKFLAPSDVVAIVKSWGQQVPHTFVGRAVI